MKSKIDLVLELTKSLRHHEDAIVRIRFELGNIIEPPVEAPKRAKKVLAGKVAKKVGGRRTIKSDDDLRASVLEILKAGPLSTKELEPTARASKKRLADLLQNMAKQKLISQESTLSETTNRFGLKWSLV